MFPVNFHGGAKRLLLQMHLRLVYIVDLSVDVRGQRGISVKDESDNAVASVPARKNKTHCMTNTRHTFLINGEVGFNGIFRKSHPCQIH